MKSLGLLLILLTAPLATSSTEPARAPRPDSLDPADCPYCGAKQKRMQRAGIYSHGGFEFATTDTAGVEELLPELPLRWIETEHFELGFALGPRKVELEEKKTLRAELERLSKVLPSVKPKTKTLDPWLRVHLYAQRLEDLYARMLEILEVSQSDFPDGKSEWMIGTPYFGDGPHLGEKGKYEVLILPDADDQVTFLHSQFGLQLRHTQKWNNMERDSMILVTNLTEDNIRDGMQLRNHVTFNMVHQLVDGYKHYSYDTPLYLKEGLAHFMEREINPRFNSFSFSEGGLPEDMRKSDWDKAVARMIQKGRAPRLAELVSLRGFAEFDADDHLACWSMTVFLLEHYPHEYAQLFARLHGRKDEKGYPDGSNMREVHRKAFRELIMPYAAFDQVWQAWALAR
ncbi:MAG TPA: hypothetical protein ENJ09_05370 [Planctomycetes bacterium]|nr:hypothetical protein [Planctomycetota bacterium]